MGHYCYPSSGTEDWICTFEDENAAKQAVGIKKCQYGGEDKVFLRKEQGADDYTYYFDWYEIVDLREWTE